MAKTKKKQEDCIISSRIHPDGAGLLAARLGLHRDEVLSLFGNREGITRFVISSTGRLARLPAART